MKGWSALSSGIKLILGLGAALFIAIVALGLLGPGGGTPTEIAAEPASTDAPDAVADTSEPADDVGDDQGISDDAAPADTADATATTPSEDDVSTGPAPPRFDIVRVDADGNALIAGRAAPGSLIAFLLDGIVFAEEDADQAGNFVAITIIPLTDAPQSLSIRMSTSDDLVVHSEQTVIIAPAATSEPVVVAEAAPQASDEPSSDTSAAITISPSEPEEAPAQVASTEPADDPPSSDDAGAAGDAGSDLLQDPGGLEVASLSEAPEGDDAPSVAADATSSDDLDAASTTENSTSTASVAPLVVLADDEGVTVLQPSGGAPSVLDAIALDSIAYDAPSVAADATSSDDLDAASTTENSTSTASVAPLVVLADDEGVTVLQPSGGAPSVLDAIALDSIAYDAPSVAADATSSDALDAASTTENSTSTASVAPLVVLADDEGVTVLQPSGGAPSVLDAIALDSIAYDAPSVAADATSSDALDAASTTENSTSTASVAPLVVLADDEGVTVLQPSGGAPSVLDAIALDSIAYDEPSVAADATSSDALDAASTTENSTSTASVAPLVVLADDEGVTVLQPSGGAPSVLDAIALDSIAYDAPSVAADATSSDALDAASTTENSTSTASVAPSVVLADDEGVTVLQPSGGAPSVLDAIVLDSIAYDATGDVTLSGRGTGTGFVRVYLNNAPVGTLRIEADGRWRAPLPEVDTGIYTLRIDEIDEAGNVISRVETPFKREEPSVLAAAIEAGRDKDVSVVTVQKGNTLWGISRKNYGRGILYVHVFEANRDQIQNPHLIYPGQVFTIPDNPEPVADR